jgi:peptidyl-prolyl cis-trans isomerase SurA
MTSEDSTKLQNKIFEIYDLAIADYNWDLLCKENSDDPNSRERGGTLTPFGVGEMVPSIAEPAFSLTEIGEISDPIMSQYGWHILKLNGVTPLPSFEDYKAQLSRRIQRDSRSNKSKEALVSRLKIENEFQENYETKSMIYNLVDSISFTGSWKIEEVDGDTWIFSLSDSVYNVNDFESYVNKNFRKAGTGHESLRINQLFNSFVEEELIEYEKQHLESKYEDYRYLMKEYREGILLFEIMEDEVWAKSGIDSLGLFTFYQNNLDDYKVKESASLITFEAINDLEAQNLLDRLNQIVEDTTINLENVKELVAKEFPEVTINIAKNIKTDDTGWADWMSAGNGVYKTGDRNEVAAIMDYKPETFSELDQIKGIVISDYQDFLDKEWIETLNRKYKVRINKKELNILYNSLVQ